MLDSLSYVIPTFRTASTLPELVDRLAHVTPAIARTHEVVVVDDACPEASGHTVVGRANVRVLAFDSNQGQRTAVLTGLARTTSEAVCVMDADLQDDPRSLSVLTQPLLAGVADVVCAGRAGRHQAVTRRVEAWAFRRTRWAVTGGAVPADAGLFHVATRRAVDDLLRHAKPGDDPMVVYARAGASIHSVPLERHAREHGTSSYTTSARARMALATFRTVAPRPRAAAPWPICHDVTTTTNPSETEHR